MNTPNDIINILLNKVPYEIAKNIVYKYGGCQTPTARIMNKFINYINLVYYEKPDRYLISIKPLDIDRTLELYPKKKHITRLYQCYYFCPAKKIKPDYKTINFITSTRICYQ